MKIRARDLKNWEALCKDLQDKGFLRVQDRVRIDIEQGMAVARLLCVDKWNTVVAVDVTGFFEDEEFPNPQTYWDERGFMPLECV